MNTSLELYLLGPVEIRWQGQLLHGFESRKALALLCYLAEQKRPVSRTQLIHLFWSDKEERRGRANLSRVLHNNMALLPGCFVTLRDTVEFKPQGTTFVDAYAFLELSKGAHLPALLEAESHYRGDFMGDMLLKGCPDFDAWLATEQELWHQRVASLLHTLIAKYRNDGNYEQGLKFAERLLRLEPWREEAHREMMLMLALSGQRTAALAQYEKCCDILIEELGVNPSAETTALYYRICNGKVRSQAGQNSGVNYIPASVKQIQPTRLPVAAMVAEREIDSPLLRPPLAPLEALPPPDERQGNEFDQILERLANPSCRMLTLVGPNNAVQKRLLFDVVSSLIKAFRHGVCYVAGQRHGVHGLLGDIAASLNLAQGEPTWDHAENAVLWLFKQLREKELLLVISDVEPYRSDTLSLLEEILKRAPLIKLLINAQAPLQISSEWIFDI